MAVIAADVDDPAVVNHNVTDVVGAVRRRGVYKIPCHTRIEADGESAIGSDKNMVCIRWIDGDSKRRGLGTPGAGRAKVDRRSGCGRVSPGGAAVRAHIDARPAIRPPVVK